MKVTVYRGLLFSVLYTIYIYKLQVLAKHDTLEEAVDEICETMVKKKKEPVKST